MNEVKRILNKLHIRIYKRVGNEYQVYCYFRSRHPHDHDLNHSYVNANTGKYLCFFCGAKGSIFTLAKHHGYSYQREPVKAVQVRHKTNGLFDQLLLLQNKSNNQLDLDKLRMPRLPTNCKYLLDNINNPEAYPYFNYCHKRGLSIYDIKHYHVSYVTYGTFLTQSKKEAPISHSIIFFTKYHGKYCYWNSRVIDNAFFPKTFNASAQPGEFSRKDVVFNLCSFKPKQIILLAEGAFNSITLDHINKYVCGVSTYGKNRSDTQIRLLASEPFSALFICNDSDAFNDSFKDYHALIKYGVDPSKLYIVDDRNMKSLDWNDVGSKRSLKIIQSNSFRLDFYSRLRLFFK